MSEKLFVAQKELHNLTKKREAFLSEQEKLLAEIDGEIREALQRVQEAAEAMLGSQLDGDRPQFTKGPIKTRVVLYLGQMKKWAVAEDIAKATHLEVHQVEVCLRNGKAKTMIFELDAGKWRLSSDGRKLHEDILKKV